MGVLGFFLRDSLSAFSSDMLGQMAWISLKLIYKLYLNCEGEKRLSYGFYHLQSAQNILQVSHIKNLIGRCFKFLQASVSPRLYDRENI